MSPRLRKRVRCATWWTLVLSACEHSTLPVAAPGPDVPVSISASGRSVPENVLSARVVFVAPFADSARISYWPTGGLIRATAFRPGREGTDTIIVLGLRGGTTYNYQVEGHGNGTFQKSAVGTFQTAALPAALANVQLVPLSGHTSQLTLTSVNAGPGSWAVAFDDTGAIIWYHDFFAYGQPASNIQKQENGNFTAYVGRTSGWQPVDGYFVEITPDGKEVAQFHAPAGYFVDNHEMVLTGSGSDKKAHLFTYSIRTLDLTSVGGRAAVQTAGHQIARLNAAGTPEFVWDAWDNISIDEWIGDASLKAGRTETDFDHPNALTFDTEGNYVVSWRHLNQIMGVDARSGAALWRVGGAKRSHAFVSDPLGGFNKQHAVKILPNGNMLLFDNGPEHSPPESRAVEYRLDHATKTATMVWEYRHDPALFTAVVGWTERLRSGNTWVAFAGAGRVVEITPSREVVWEGQLRVNGASAGAYRIIAIGSLY